MATIAFEGVSIPEPDNRRVDIVKWTVGGADNDEGSPYVSYLRPDKTVQLIAEDFASTTVVIEGTNDDPANDNWQTLTDADGNPLSFTTAGLKFVRESPRYLRPRASSGTGSIQVILVAANMGRDW